MLGPWKSFADYGCATAPARAKNGRMSVTVARTCTAQKDLRLISGERCGNDAAYQTRMGPRCVGCIEHYRRALRSPRAFINVLHGRAMTGAEIEASIVAIQ
jgi:hypothetical protein